LIQEIGLEPEQIKPSESVTAPGRQHDVSKRPKHQLHAQELACTV
jgi:hypothetical protein